MAALAALTIACGCSPQPTGVLGNGEFSYLCDGDADVACTGADTDTDLPGAIAVGSTFRTRCVSRVLPPAAAMPHGGAHADEKECGAMG